MHQTTATKVAVSAKEAVGRVEEKIVEGGQNCSISWPKASPLTSNEGHMTGVAHGEQLRILMD